MTLTERINAALAELASDLLEAGIPSDPDPGKVRISKEGGAWLHPRTFEQTRLAAGGGTLRVEVWLVIPDLDNPWAELQLLTGLLDEALSIPYLAPAEPIDLDAVLSLPDNPACPACLLVIDLDV